MAHRRAGLEPGAAVRAVLLAVMLVPSIPLPSAAASVEGIAGWEGDGLGQGYGFLAGGAFSSGKTGVGISARLTASYLYYEFHEAGSEVHIQAPGVSALAGVRRNHPTGGFSILSGGELRRERREPALGPVGVLWRGGLVAQVEGNLNLGRFQPQALVVYSGAASGYLYGKGTLRWQLTNRTWAGPVTWFAGVEGIGQGNSDVEAVQAGGVVECVLARRHLSLGLHGGLKRVESDGTGWDGGYAGVSFYHAL